MSPLIFAYCRDCPSYLASAETVRDLLLPAETTVHEKLLPAGTVCVITLPVETLGSKQNHTDSLYRKLPSTDYRPQKWLLAETVRVILLLLRLSAGSKITRTVSAGSYLPCTTVSAGSKRSRTVSVDAKYDGQSL